MVANVDVGGSSPSSLTAVALKADLLLGLAQGRVGEVGVLGVPAPAGKGDLPGVAAQVGAAPGEDDVRLPVWASRNSGTSTAAWIGPAGGG